MLFPLPFYLFYLYILFLYFTLHLLFLWTYLSTVSFPPLLHFLVLPFSLCTLEHLVFLWVFPCTVFPCTVSLCMPSPAMLQSGECEPRKGVFTWLWLPVPPLQVRLGHQCPKCSLSLYSVLSLPRIICCSFWFTWTYLQQSFIHLRIVYYTQ